jgi:signal transduction histidine kinase
MKSFDIINCQSNIGPLFTYVYAIEILSIFFVLFIGFKKYLKVDNQALKRQILFIVLGTTFFISMLSFSNIFGEIFKAYEINLVGPIGMVIFLGLLSYLIVRFQVFNVKLIATQALVWGLAALIGAQFFFIRVLTNFILNGFTFIASIIFGYFLIKSVKVEIEQKEELLKLNIELHSIIKQRESLVHLVTHKIKGSFTRTKYIFAEMIDGTFGEISPEIKKRAEQGLDSDNAGIRTVDLVLNAGNLQKGVIKYDMKIFDLKELILKTIAEKKIRANSGDLKIEDQLESEPSTEVYNVLGDAFWLKEAISKLLENAIEYTKVGTVKVGLEKRDGKIIFSVKDTGVGITDEDKKNLFTEGGRGKDSVRVNVDSTGYGLYSVKLIVDAHKGRVWAESEGAGKGSTFSIELPAV